MIHRHIRADNQEHIGVLDILIARRRAIRTERLDIPYHRRRHAEPAVRVHVIGTEKSLEQFVEEVGGFCIQLSRAIEGNRVLAVLQLDIVQAICDESDSFVPRNPARGFVSPVANHRIGKPAVRMLKRLFEMRAFRTKHAVVRREGRVR